MCCLHDLPINIPGNPGLNLKPHTVSTGGSFAVQMNTFYAIFFLKSFNRVELKLINIL